VIADVDLAKAYADVVACSVEADESSAFAEVEKAVDVRVIESAKVVSKAVPPKLAWPLLDRLAPRKVAFPSSLHSSHPLGKDATPFSSPVQD